MTIKTITVHRVVCDRCGVELPNIFRDRMDASTAAGVAGWKPDGTRHYCPHCATPHRCPECSEGVAHE